MSSTTVQRGNILQTFLFQAALTPVAVATVSSAEQTFTIPGLLLGDQVSGLSLQAAWSGLSSIVSSRVSAANTLAVSFQNGTGGSVTPPAGVYWIEVNRPENTPLPLNAT